VKYLQLFSLLSHGAIAGVHVHECCQTGQLNIPSLLLAGAYLILALIQMTVLLLLVRQNKNKSKQEPPEIA
jgi:hypothetical protein